ncbi:LptA/OstA family protein [Chelatococcus sp. SYSU_G07232]|uniref:LptA/OstA family protein n=1 Tax=Chelatococcus albus TaxID=3047466 RepID=A0ABT7AIF9_9HYPH|nr:LptA/OstA family protein [Chelatococcus sp. SYSU_G07232]MDJ1158782.1 LptA/OstA family protein [Chelatococcus sp. SYSU_G07232]
MNRLPTALLALALALPGGTALAQQKPPPAKSSPLGGLGSNSKDPIKIDADRLDVFDKEQKAVFAGNVVAVQGETTMRCSTLTVYYEQSATKGAAGAAPAAQGQDNSNIKKLDCKGPVTVVSKDQTATGSDAVYDRVADKVILSGKVTLSQGQNVQQCERVVYSLDSSVATCEAKPGGRVQGVFVPGSTPDQAAGAPKPKAKAN